MDYKAILHEDITQLRLTIKNGYKKAKKSNTDCSLKSFAYRANGLRFTKIESLIEDYFAKTGEMPDSVILERMADICLYEELTDTDRMKVRNNEYPFLSETQFEERRSAEASFKLAEEQGVDGRNYKPPVRRDRTTKENKFMDENARIRNRERRKTYHEFTKVQPVVVRKMSN
jgi:hypothetical protein